MAGLGGERKEKEEKEGRRQKAAGVAIFSHFVTFSRCPFHGPKGQSSLKVSNGLSGPHRKHSSIQKRPALKWKDKRKSSARSYWRVGGMGTTGVQPAIS
jgi:hypothetical protein